MMDSLTFSWQVATASKPGLYIPSTLTTDVRYDGKYHLIIEQSNQTRCEL